MIFLQPINNLSAAEWNKKQLSEFGKTYVESRADEGHDLLQLVADLTKLDTFCKATLPVAKAKALADVRLYGKEGVGRAGVELVVREVGVAYDYKADPIWRELEAAEKQAAELRKSHENYLRSIPIGGRDTLNPATGEVYTAYAPARYGGDGVIATFK